MQQIQFFLVLYIYAGLTKHIPRAIANLLLTVCWASYSAILVVPGLPAGQRVRASRRLRQETTLLLKHPTVYFNDTLLATVLPKNFPTICLSPVLTNFTAVADSA
jgi:hypothetical protein